MPKTAIKDLEYELHLLLGASKIIRAIEQYDSVKKNDNEKLGNTVNHFKDSAYIHIRNLYNYFSNATRNDGKVSEYTNHNFNLNLYNQWSDALHQHAVHVRPGRNNPNNEINGVHINTMIPSFANDLDNLWQEWINTTSDSSLKIKLQDALVNAHKESDEDRDNLMRALR